MDSNGSNGARDNDLYITCIESLIIGAITLVLTGLLILLFACFRVLYLQCFVSPRLQSRTQQGVPDVEPAGPPSPPDDLSTPPAASTHALLFSSSVPAQALLISSFAPALALLVSSSEPAQALPAEKRIRRRSISNSNHSLISYPSNMSSHASLDSVFLHSGETPEPSETNRNPTEADANDSDVESNCMSKLDSHSSLPSNNEPATNCHSDSGYSDAKSTQMTTVDQRPTTRVSSNNEPTTPHLSVSSQTQTRRDTDPAVTSEDTEVFHLSESVDRSDHDGSHMETSHSDPAFTSQDLQSNLNSEGIEDLNDRGGYMDDFSPFRAYLSVNLERYQPSENSDRSYDTGGSTETFHPNSPVTSQRLSTFGGFKCTSVGSSERTGIYHTNPALMSKDLKESEVLESVDLSVGSGRQMETFHPGSALVAEDLSECQVLESVDLSVGSGRQMETFYPGSAPVTENRSECQVLESADHQADDSVYQSPTSGSDSTTSSEDLKTRRLLESADQSEASGSYRA